jgi:hypothetical protein
MDRCESPVRAEKFGQKRIPADRRGVFSLIDCAYAEIADGSYDLFFFEKNRPLGPSGHFSALMMARPDFDIKSIELPPVSEQDIQNLLKFKLRSLYPGKPDDTVFDYTILSRKNKKYALLFITEKETIETYRNLSNGMPLFLPFTLVKPLIRKYSDENCAFIFYHTRWIEILMIHSGMPVFSSVINREKSFEINFQKIQTLLQESSVDCSLVFICAKEETDALNHAIRGSIGPGGSYSMVRIEELVGSLNKKSDFLFSERQKKRAVPHTLIIFLFTAIVLTLSILILDKDIRQREAYFEQLENRMRSYEHQTLSMKSLENELKELENHWMELHSRSPVNIYHILSELSSIIEGRAVITYFVIEKDSFQFEAVGQNPLDLMDTFKMNENFQSIKLLQSIPVQGTNKERFKVIGVVKNQ